MSPAHWMVGSRGTQTVETMLVTKATRKAPKKRRHTSKRIFESLRAETTDLVAISGGGVLAAGSSAWRAQVDFRDASRAA